MYPDTGSKLGPGQYFFADSLRGGYTVLVSGYANMSAFPSVSTSKPLDSLTDVSGFGAAPAGSSYALRRAAPGEPYEPSLVTSSPSITPGGGLELVGNPPALQLKLDPSLDNNCSLSANGLLSTARSGWVVAKEVRPEGGIPSAPSLGTWNVREFSEYTPYELHGRVEFGWCIQGWCSNVKLKGPGTFVIQASAPAWDAGPHRAAFHYDNPDGLPTMVYGTSEASGPSSCSSSVVHDKVTLVSGETKDFRLVHQVTTQEAKLGCPNGFGPELYCWLRVDIL